MHTPVVRFNTLTQEEWEVLVQQEYDEYSNLLVGEGYRKVAGEGIYPHFFVKDNEKYYLARKLGSPTWYLRRYYEPVV